MNHSPSEGVRIAVAENLPSATHRSPRNVRLEAVPGELKDANATLRSWIERGRPVILALTGLILFATGCSTAPTLVGLGTDPVIVKEPVAGAGQGVIWLEATGDFESVHGTRTARLIVQGARVSLDREGLAVGARVGLSPASALLSGPAGCICPPSNAFVAWHDGSGLAGRFVNAGTFAPLTTQASRLTPELNGEDAVPPYDYDLAYDAEAGHVVLIYTAAGRQAWMRFITLGSTGLPVVGPPFAIGSPPQSWPRLAIAPGSPARNLVVWLRGTGTTEAKHIPLQLQIGGAVFTAGGAPVSPSAGAAQFAIDGYYHKVAATFDAPRNRFLILGESGPQDGSGNRNIDAVSLPVVAGSVFTPSPTVSLLINRPVRGESFDRPPDWKRLSRARPEVFALTSGNSTALPVVAYRVTTAEPSVRLEPIRGSFVNYFDNWISTTAVPDGMGSMAGPYPDRTGGRSSPLTSRDWPRFYRMGDLAQFEGGLYLLFAEGHDAPLPFRSAPALVLRAFTP